MIYLFNCPASGTDEPCPRSGGGSCACLGVTPTTGRALCCRAEETEDEALRRQGVSPHGQRLTRIAWPKE